MQEVDNYDRFWQGEMARLVGEAEEELGGMQKDEASALRSTLAGLMTLLEEPVPGSWDGKRSERR